MRTPDCVFCQKIDDGDTAPVPATGIVHFEPLNPVTKGHRLFVPDWHTEHPAPLAVGEAMRAAALWAAQNLRANLGYNLITSSGHHATQTIAHVHVHLVPRRSGDGLLLPWGEPK